MMHTNEELLECIQNLMGILDTPIGRRKLGLEFSKEAIDIAREIMERPVIKWTEINSVDDLPNPDQYCWFCNRTNGHIFISKLNGQMGRTLSHLTFSHYMPILLNSPISPNYRRSLMKLNL